MRCSLLVDTRHRPWAIPSRRWAIAMCWHDLLFMHWPLPERVLRPLIPLPLAIDTFDGHAWLGVTSFWMSGVRPRYVPAVPGLSVFPELNVRTYVTIGGKPGVWFFSLDATNSVAVYLARWTFHLPYYTARMTVTQAHGRIQYDSLRIHRHAPPAQWHGWYQPTGPVYHARSGTLEHWLTERYCLYAADRHDGLWRGEIHHRPWPLQQATVEVSGNTMTIPLGVTLPSRAPLLHFAQRLEVVAWSLERATLSSTL